MGPFKVGAFELAVLALVVVVERSESQIVFDQVIGKHTTNGDNPYVNQQVECFSETDECLLTFEIGVAMASQYSDDGGRSWSDTVSVIGTADVLGDNYWKSCTSLGQENLCVVGWASGGKIETRRTRDLEAWGDAWEESDSQFAQDADAEKNQLHCFLVDEIDIDQNTTCLFLVEKDDDTSPPLVFRSTDGGVNWDPGYALSPFIAQVHGADVQTSTQIECQQSKCLLLIGDKTWRSLDAGASFQQVGSLNLVFEQEQFGSECEAVSKPQSLKCIENKDDDCKLLVHTKLSGNSCPEEYTRKDFLFFTETLDFGTAWQPSQLLTNRSKTGFLDCTSEKFELSLACVAVLDIRGRFDDPFFPAVPALFTTTDSGETWSFQEFIEGSDSFLDNASVDKSSSEWDVVAESLWCDFEKPQCLLVAQAICDASPCSTSIESTTLLANFTEGLPQQTTSPTSSPTNSPSTSPTISPSASPTTSPSVDSSVSDNSDASGSSLSTTVIIGIAAGSAGFLLIASLAFWSVRSAPSRSAPIRKFDDPRFAKLPAPADLAHLSVKVDGEQ